jgi:hypothetical protein
VGGASTGKVWIGKQHDYLAETSRRGRLRALGTPCRLAPLAMTARPPRPLLGVLVRLAHRLRDRALVTRAVGAAFLLVAIPNTAQAKEDLAAAPLARLALGPAFHVSPHAERGTQLALDATLGLNAAFQGWRDAGLVLTGEGGYAYDGVGLHAAQATLGIGWGHPLIFFSYHPRVLVGSAGDGLALGMRNGLTLHGVGDLVSLEIGEQFFHDTGGMHHDARVMFGLNPGAFAFLLTKIN